MFLYLTLSLKILKR